MNRFVTRIGIAVLFALLVANCDGTSKDEDLSALALIGSTNTTPTPELPETDCATTLSAATGAQELCEPAAGTGVHYRIQGVQMTGAHVAFCLTKGWSDATCLASPSSAGQFKYTLYTGGPPPPAMSYANYGNATNASTTPVPDFKTALADICFDITQTSPTRVTFWSTGQGGADCGDKSTLTAGNSILNKSDWTDTSAPAVGASYAAFSNATGSTAPTITVSTVSALP